MGWAFCSVQRQSEIKEMAAPWGIIRERESCYFLFQESRSFHPTISLFEVMQNKITTHFFTYTNYLHLFLYVSTSSNTTNNHCALLLHKLWIQESAKYWVSSSSCWRWNSFESRIWRIQKGCFISFEKASIPTRKIDRRYKTPMLPL